ncbi:MAG: hypothetical protein V3T05_11065 [Myxococcota bacterium]
MRTSPATLYRLDPSRKPTLWKAGSKAQKTASPTQEVEQTQSPRMDRLLGRVATPRNLESGARTYRSAVELLVSRERLGDPTFDQPPVVVDRGDISDPTFDQPPVVVGRGDISDPTFDQPPVCG